MCVCVCVCVCDGERKKKKRFCFHRGVYMKQRGMTFRITRGSEKDE